MSPLALGPLWILWLLALPAVGAGNSGPFLESKVEPAEPYVQQELRYRVRLFRRTHLDQGWFHDPAPDDAVVEFVGETEPLRVAREDGEWEVIERLYLLYPQRSGVLEIPAPVFSGRSLFVVGEPSTVRVRPRADSAAVSLWLPARGFRLHETWSTPHRRVRVGDHLERVLVLEAEGLTGAQLPALRPVQVSGLEIQHLGTRISQTLHEDRRWGRREERWLVIPREAGDHSLPEIRIPWWDTGADGLRSAELRQRRFSAESAPSREGRALSYPRTAPSASEAWEGPSTGLDFFLASGLLAAVAITLLLRYRAGGSTAISRRWRLWWAGRRFRRACRAGDARAAKSALLEWGATRFGATAGSSLAAVAARVSDTRLREALWEVDRAVYSGAREWNAVAAIDRLRPLFGTAGEHRRPRRSPIPLLNP